VGNLVVDGESKLLAAAIARYDKIRSNECLDPFDLDSRPTPQQEAILRDIGKIQSRWIVAGNRSGKSALGAREVAWVWEENHPFWKRPSNWGDEPLVIILASQTRMQLEEIMWHKVSGFVSASDYTLHKTGAQIQTVVHKNGNKLIFLSYQAEDQAKKKMQGFDAHYVWIDEMPGNANVIEELQSRIMVRGGIFLATFTPKVRNDQIRRLVDSSIEPYAKKYKLLMMDNPATPEKAKQAKLHELSTKSESFRKTVLEGEWCSGDESVYDFHEEHRANPPNYHRSWRHVLSVDPAMASKLGMTLWGEDPSSGVWYLIRSDYVSNITAPDDYVKAVERKVMGYNIVRRISDTEQWYIGAASKLGYSYIPIPEKSKRKNELIKNLQTALDRGEIKIPDWNTDLIDEFTTCQWSETVEGKIVGSQRFHLLDCCQYFVDLRPKSQAVDPSKTFADRMVASHEKRLAAESAMRHGGKFSRGRRKWDRRRA